MGWDDVQQQARGRDMLTLEGCVEWSHPEQTRREALLAELARLRAIEAAARRLLTLDVADPVARAIALAVIASGLREALGLA